MQISFFKSLFIILLFLLLQACGGGGDKIDRTTPPVEPQKEKKKENKEFTLYEDAEDNATDGWEVYAGKTIENVPDGAMGSKRSIFLHENWLKNPNGSFTKDENGYPTNDAHYEFPMQSDKYFVLEFDKKKKISNGNELYCFTVGMIVETIDGTRVLSFNTFYDREKMQPDTQLLNGGIREYIFPLSMSYVNDKEVWKHVKLDLSAYLQQFETNNTILNTTSFYFEGGDDYLDNLVLSKE